MPAGATPMPKEFARQLLEYEAALGKRADPKHSAAFGVCEKLRVPLGRLMGAAGYSSLLSRALVLAGAEAPWLRELLVNADGTVEGLDETEAGLEKDSAAEGEVFLVGHLLGLLVTFIGPALTLQLLHDIWPKWAIKVFENEETA